MKQPPVGSLYIHVPFCAQKCGYCAFYSEPAGLKLKSRYVQALLRELELTETELKPQTIYFGGGTPSLLSIGQWEEIVKGLRSRGCGKPVEWTVECNPATISAEKARFLRSAGVNRISLGVQSLDDGLLERLGRIHTRKTVFRTYDLLRKSGFENINLDLMFAIPGQGLGTWRKTLREARAMDTEHLSCYEVTYEEDTRLYAELEAGKISPDEDQACAMYDELLETAAAAGLEQYEIANFARRGTQTSGAHSGLAQQEARETQEDLLRLPGFACRHNVNYWRGGAFVGLGPSATTYVGGVRQKNWPNTQLYCDLIENGRATAQSSEQLSPLGRAGETAAFGLRMTTGWPFEQFRAVTGFELRQEWAADLQELVKRGWASVTDERVSLTPAGLRFADAAAQLLLR
jgi:oxygen-independent coproporphyrinogen III oxidase